MISGNTYFYISPSSFDMAPIEELDLILWRT